MSIKAIAVCELCKKKFNTWHEWIDKEKRYGKKIICWECEEKN